MSNDEDSISDDCMEDFNNYYAENDSDNAENQRSERDDPEHYSVECLSVEEVNHLFDRLTKTVCLSLHISPSLARMLLYKNNWKVDYVISRGHKDLTELLVECFLKRKNVNMLKKRKSSRFSYCELTLCFVCATNVKAEDLRSLDCGHMFCSSCWVEHIRVRLSEGAGVEISCMEQSCNILALEDFVLNLPASKELQMQYKRFAFQSFVKSYSLLKFCVGYNCSALFKVETILAKRVCCSACNAVFCFKCGLDYHAPTDCATIKDWLTKCADDSETANYFSTHTKDCPKCNICIEKNGGCNHMQCYKCKYDFCWMCLGDWKVHGSEYYECSRYKENPDAANETAKAREALKKYLHYYERWYNHSQSLKLEEQTVENIKVRINKKVMNKSGTWIDWQYLLEASTLLANCRYTLQYTYPYAYYMQQQSRKDLFEYQQAQLEAEIENLSWKIERAETTDRGELENQMYIAEKRRKTLLKDFFHS